MADAFYPTFREEQVLVMNTIITAVRKDPLYLDRKECPYSDQVKALFRRFVTEEMVTVDVFAEGDYDNALDKQVEKIINDLEAYALTLGTGDVSERLQYLKTKTTLVEKLINMRERLVNLKELNEFRGVILGFMGDVCTKDQITDLMKRLDGVFGIDGTRT